MKVLSLSICVMCLGGLAIQGQVTLNRKPSRVLGHPRLDLNTTAPDSFSANLVEGKELSLPNGIAVDKDNNILYVSDTGNNRVLIWMNASGFSNGSPADRVIGQPDFYTTFGWGPGTPYSTFLNSPTGLAVLNGDLYVVDSGNNRIMRFPNPTAQSDPITPDLVLGQPNFNSRALGRTDRSIYTNDGNNLFRSSIAFDAQGNLWATDPGNNRVIRFPKSSLNPGSNAPADLVLGQNDLFSVSATQITALTKDRFSQPSALAIDQATGNMLVSDAGRRVLMFPPGSFVSGQVNQPDSVRVLGVVVQVPGQPAPTQSAMDHTVLQQPEGLFIFGSGNVGVLDQYYSRIMIFDPPSRWPVATTGVPSPQAIGTAPIGQANFTTNQGPNGRPANLSTSFNNQGLAMPTATSLNHPAHAVVVNNELYVADFGNNRIVVLPLQGTTFGGATRVLGQADFGLNAVNFIEGREFAFGGISGLAIDTTSDPPHLYVADPANNRILGFNDVRKLAPGTLLTGTYFQMGAKADLVIGQPDMLHNVANYNAQDPFNSDPSRPNRSSLFVPAGIALDPDGNLWVADNGNGRVLRFPKPFATLGTLPAADRVVGQASFTAQLFNTQQNTMRSPYGVIFDPFNGLLVSDNADNRVLLFSLVNGDIPSGSPATKVFGQSRFISGTAGNGPDQLNAPRHVAFDSDGRPYVADEGNGRVVIYDSVSNDPPTGAIGTILSTGLNRPRGLYVSQSTGEIWVGDAGTGSAHRFTNFNNLQNENFAPDNSIGAAPAGYALSPLAVTLDQFGDLIVADSSNRVSFFYRSLLAVNGASYYVSNQGVAPALTPGMLATICPPLRSGSSIRACQADDPHNFGEVTASVNDLPNPLPWPAAMGDTQVLVNGNPAPLSAVTPRQINFQVPWATPLSGQIDLEVVRQSTGQVLGAGTVTMNGAAPAIFTQNGTGTGPGVVYNQDGSLNTTANAAARASLITIYMTGQGPLPNPPADGDAPQGQVDVSTNNLQVVIGSSVIDASTKGQDGNPAIAFCGLTPGSVGVWQINVRIPDAVAPGAAQPLGVRYKNVFNNNNDPARVLITMAVKQ